jgi:hypothetical protein
LKDCPRPVPPFPFKVQGYIVGEDQHKMLRAVWAVTVKIKDDVKEKRSRKKNAEEEAKSDSDNSGSGSSDGEEEEVGDTLV